MPATNIIYDWNKKNADKNFPEVELCDETLRDGIQSPSVRDPNIEEKYELIELMDALHICIADIGLPAAGPRAFQDVLGLANYVKKRKLKIQLNCAARTLEKDIEPIARIQESAGIAITAYCFLGTSPVRQLVEDWSLETLKRTIDKAFRFGLKENLKMAFVTEDTVRSRPETLELLFSHAINLGVERLVLCDTVGHASPAGVKALVTFTKDIISRSGQNVKIDWHGHNDRGLGVVNALFAAEYGCDRIHGTALGIGERVGNTALDQLIVNLKLLGVFPHDVNALVNYVEKAAALCKVPIPYNYPVFGYDAFRTATGVHAAAVIKAKQHNDSLSDIIYSGVPAHWFGKSQMVDIGPMSGASNVRYWLTENHYEASDSLCEPLLAYAKTKEQVLSNAEIHAFIKEKQAR
jgi:2-isopropylmalate synthase